MTRIDRGITSSVALVAILAIFGASAVFAQGVSPDATIWDGPTITFEKADGADPSGAANQDRLTDSVWITRSNDGGQIFNIRRERRPNKGRSPVDTEWAVGTLDELAELRFQPFRRAVGSPRTVAGTDLVLHIIPEDIYVQVRFTSWSEGQLGGFAYERSTP